MPSVGPWELAIILVIVVIIFGVGKLPEIGGALGKGIKEFRTSASTDDDVVTVEKSDVKSSSTNTPIKEEL
jgi:sec-independent protein translocase protein TatA